MNRQHWQAEVLTGSILGSILGTLLYAQSLVAQVIPDNTLPVGERSQVTGNPNFQIDGGARRGGNLFHSFQSFSVPTGGSAFFNNAADVQNILTRVTGGSLSNIDGLIRANGTANLFLLNPNGIIFSPKASLNIGGSFVASTASSLLLADGTVFSARPTAPTAPLLTLIVPIGLQYGSNPGSVQVQGSNLQVNSGQTLALAGGNVTVNGGQLLAPGGRVEFAGVAPESSVEFVANRSSFDLSFPVSRLRTDVAISNNAIADVRSGGGGEIVINARNLDITGGNTQLQAGIASGNGSVDARAGNIEINATGAINLNASLINNEVQAGAVGHSGNINITTKSLSVTNGALLNASTLGQGNASSVNILAHDTVSFNNSDAFSRVEADAVGKGGNINITTGSLSVINGARLDTGTFGQGDAGSVNILAHNTVSFDGVNSAGRPSAAYSNVLAKAVGNGGNINITAGSLFLSNGSRLVVSVLGQGNGGTINIQSQQFSLTSNASLQGDLSESAQGQGGNINLDVKGAIFLAGGETARTGESTRITLGVLPGGRGSGGDININAGSLVLTDGAFIKASTQGQGSAGNIHVNADMVDISGSVPSSGLASGLFTSTDTSFRAGDIVVDTQKFRVADGAALSARSRGDGSGGNIRVNATDFEAVNGGQLVTTTFGQGQAGNIFVNATDRIAISGSDPNYAVRLAKFPNPISSLIANAITETGAASGLFANTGPNSAGHGGNVQIATGLLAVQAGAKLITSTSGSGRAGDITVNTPEFIGDGSIITAGTGGSGTGGNLNLTTGTLKIQDRAEVTVSGSGTGSAGSLFVDANQIYLDHQGSIRADTSGGGGNMNLRSPLIELRHGSNITTNATGKDIPGGDIAINTQFLVAVPKEDSNISANSEDFRGGNVSIKAFSIFGIQPRPQPTSLSDITATGATSALTGTLNVTTVGIDPTAGLVEFPTEVVDPSRLIAQGCAANQGNSFVISGRGGLPPNPEQQLDDDADWQDRRRLAAAQQTSHPTVRTLSSLHTLGPTIDTPIVEATGWRLSPTGEVMLVATTSAPAMQNELNQPTTCPGKQ